MANYNIHPLAFSPKRHLLARFGVVIPPLRLVYPDIAVDVGRFVAQAAQYRAGILLDRSVDVGRFVAQAAQYPAGILLDRSVDVGHFVAVNSLPAMPFHARVVAGRFTQAAQYRAGILLGRSVAVSHFVAQARHMASPGLAVLVSRFGAAPALNAAPAKLYPAGRFTHAAGLWAPRLHRGIVRNPGHFLQNAGLSGTFHHEIWWLKEQPLTAQLIYHCTLTGAADGLEDITLRISNFQYRLYDHGGSYLSVTVPDATAHAAKVAARRNGQLIIRRGLLYADGSRDLSEIVRAGKLEMRHNTGARNSSVTITAGSSISFATNPGVVRSTDKIISQGLQADGSYTFQIEPLNGVFPNNEIWLGNEKHLIKRVSVAIGGSVSQMNLLTEPA